MKQLVAAMVCLGTLYAIDVFFFDGWYFGIASQMIQQAYALNWW